MPNQYIQHEDYDHKKENPNDFFPTPLEVCERALQDLMPPLSPVPVRVLDAGAGSNAAWGLAARKQWPNAEIVGVDLPEVKLNVEVNPYNTWVGKDYRDLTLEDVGGRLFDIVIGNPPYSTSQGKRDLHLAEKFVNKSLELVGLNRPVMFFLRLDFLAGAHRRTSLFKPNPPRFVNVLAERVNFFPERGDGQTHNHAVFVWQKRHPDRNTYVKFWSWRT